ncbi:MAG: SDR family oxidoreductase [Anaerolineae bacterium]|nr:SDR family oxidoreductase [Anaerolineae bacterium]
MSEKHFVGQHVFVTGAGSGIGRATARRFAQEGAAHVYLVDQYQDRLDKVAADIEQFGAKPFSICVDLAQSGACDHAITEALAISDRLNVLVSNAGAWTEEPFIDLKDESWHKILAVNLTGAFIFGQRAARAMAKTGGGVILYTSSISALGANRGFAPYNVTKAGIVSLVKSMAVELAPYKIRVNAVSPGGVDTQMSIDHLGEERMARLRTFYPAAPMGRLATPEDIASVFAFLATDDASYITGQNIVVDGGLTAQIYEPPK